MTLVRFGLKMETMFGLTREVLLVYSPHRDLQFRTFQALPELINGLPRQVTQGLALVCSPDSRQAEKLDDWSTSRLLAVPITNNPDGLEDSGRALLNCLQQRIFTRDLYAETAPVRGSDFFGRRRILLQSLPNDVDEGRVFGVFGLRKSGKTSILKRVGEELVAHRLRRSRPLSAAATRLTPMLHWKSPGVQPHWPTPGPGPRKPAPGAGSRHARG